MNPLAAGFVDLESGHWAGALAAESQLGEVRGRCSGLLGEGAALGLGHGVKVRSEFHNADYNHNGNSLATVSDISGRVTTDHSAVMTIAEIRRKNLAALVAAEPGGNQSTFATKIGKSASQVNQYLHFKDMGGRFARDIEKTLHLDAGWMDRDQSPTSKSGEKVVMWGGGVSKEAALLAAEWEKIESAQHREAFKVLIHACVTQQKLAARKPKRPDPLADERRPDA